MGLPDRIRRAVAYLEDLHAAALEEGAGASDARARAMAALEESAFSLLQAHALKHPDRRHAARADLMARSAGGRSLNVLSALRLAARQFRQHPTFALVTIGCWGRDGAATTVSRFSPQWCFARARTTKRIACELWDNNLKRAGARSDLFP